MTNPVVITIDGKYADVLGYQEAVGSMGIINDVMSALVEVYVLCGPVIGRTFDVHKEDITVLPRESDAKHYIIADFEKMQCYYTKSKEMYDFILHISDWGQGYRAYGECTLSETIAFYNKFVFHDVDCPLDEATKIFRDTFQSMERA